MVEAEFKYIAWIEEKKSCDPGLVGYKNANLAQLFQSVKLVNLEVPVAFFVTTEGFKYFLKTNNLVSKIEQHDQQQSLKSGFTENTLSAELRSSILNGIIPEDLSSEILSAYTQLLEKMESENKLVGVAVRSSATTEDLPKSSSAGQQDTFLNVSIDSLLENVKKVFASLYTDRAVSYRKERKLGLLDTSISVAVQQMVRSDMGSSGVIFTSDIESGSKNLVVIQAIWGLGELIAQGQVTPDEYFIYKSTTPILINKKVGSKEKKLVFKSGENFGTESRPVSAADRHRFVLSDSDAISLGEVALQLESFFGMSLDIEWAFESLTGKFFILQARPQTGFLKKLENKFQVYSLLEKTQVLTTGSAVGFGIGQGQARIISDKIDIENFKPGEVLVSKNADPSWQPVLKMASAIVTETGGKTSHASILSRELGIPAVVGSGKEIEKIKNGMPITVSCAEGETGKVYSGLVPFTVENYSLENLPATKTSVYLDFSNPQEAFGNSILPCQGVGVVKQSLVIENIFHKSVSQLTETAFVAQPEDSEIYEEYVGYENFSEAFEKKLFYALAVLCSSFAGKPVLFEIYDWQGKKAGKNLQELFNLTCKVLNNFTELTKLKNLEIVLPENCIIQDWFKFLPSNLKIWQKVSLKNWQEVAKEITPSELSWLEGFILEIKFEKDLLSADLISDCVNFVKYCRKNNKRKAVVWPDIAEYNLELTELVKQQIDFVSVHPKQALKTCLKISEIEKTP